MLRRRALAACTATVAVGALALAGLTGTASADPSPAADAPAAGADRLSPGLLKAMRRDLGLTMRPGTGQGRRGDPRGSRGRRAAALPRRRFRRGPGER